MAVFNLPDYHSQRGEIVSPGPYHFDEALAFCFMVRADAQCLQEICNTWVTRPTNRAVLATPFFPFVTIIYIYYPKVWSLAQDPAITGVIQYKEMIVNVGMRINSNPFWPDLSMNSFMAYLLLDHPKAIATGREVFGMPKIYGDIEMPDGNLNNSFSASTNTVEKFKNKFAQSTNQKIMEITCPRGFNFADYIPQKTTKDFSALQDELHSKMSAETSYREASEATNVLKADFLTFKQVRSYMNRNRTSYKALLRYQTENYKVHGGGLLQGRFNIKFPSNPALFPLKRALGLYPGISCAFWLRVSFDLQMGKEVWSPKKNIWNPFA